MKKLACVWLAVIVLAGCSAPMSKERYLEKFEAWISDVSEHYTSWSDEEWTKKNEQFERFSGEWYKKFEQDLTLQEKIKVAGFQTKFHYYKTLDQSSSILQEVKGMLETLNVDELKATVQSYVDSDRMAELKQLYDEAIQVGGTAMESITDILKELQVNVEELQE